MGRANNIARSLGLPRDVPRAARVAVTAPARPVDVLRVETPERSLLGIEGVSAGLHAAARMRYDAPDSSHLLEGVSAFAGALAAYEPWPLELELDGQLAYEGDAAGRLPLELPPVRVRVQDRPARRHRRRAARRRRARGGEPPPGRAARARPRTAGRCAGGANVTIAPAHEAVLTTPVPMVCDSEVLGTTTASVRVEQGLLTIAA